MPPNVGPSWDTMGSHPGVFRDLEEFVALHRGCATLTGGAGAPTLDGYRLWVSCSCGERFERWVTPDAAEYDLVRSRLPAFPN